jgi:hypothetical protein
MKASDNVPDIADDVSDEAPALLDLDDVLDDALVKDGPESDANDAGETAADLDEEIEVDPQVIDLAEALDATDEDLLALETPADDMMTDEASTSDVSTSEASELDVLVFDVLPPEETIEVIEADPMDDPLANADISLNDDGLTKLDLVELVDTEENTDGASGDAEEIAEPSGGQATGELFGAPDAGDELDFKLDEMLAEAQAEMPNLDDDDADMDLDLSEALADAAADSTGEESETILDLSDPVAPISADEADAFDLISEDMVIDLDEPVAPESLAEVASKHDNVIDLSEMTGGYPTVNPTSEIESETSDSDDSSAEAASLLEDVFLDEDSTDHSPVTAEPIEEDEDLDLGIALDDDESAHEDRGIQLNPEMEKLEATLDDVFQDDEGDDLDLAMFAESASDDATGGADESISEGDSPAADRVAIDLVDAGAMPAATKAPVGDLPAEITEEALDAAVSRVIKTMYADRIEQMILDVIKEAVTAEIEKVKRSLGDKA